MALFVKYISNPCAFKIATKRCVSVRKGHHFRSIAKHSPPCMHQHTSRRRIILSWKYNFHLSKRSIDMPKEKELASGMVVPWYGTSTTVSAREKENYVEKEGSIAYS